MKGALSKHLVNEQSTVGKPGPLRSDQFCAASQAGLPQEPRRGARPASSSSESPTPSFPTCLRADTHDREPVPCAGPPWGPHEEECLCFLSLGHVCPYAQSRKLRLRQRSPLKGTQWVRGGQTRKGLVGPQEKWGRLETAALRGFLSVVGRGGRAATGVWVSLPATASHSSQPLWGGVSSSGCLLVTEDAQDQPGTPPSPPPGSL